MHVVDTARYMCLGGLALHELQILDTFVSSSQISGEVHDVLQAFPRVGHTLDNE